MSVHQDLSASLQKTLHFVNHIFRVPASCILCFEEDQAPIQLWLGCAIAKATASSPFYQEILHQGLVLWQEDPQLSDEITLSKNIYSPKLHLPRFYSGIVIGSEEKRGVFCIFDAKPHTANPLHKLLLLSIKQQIESQLTLYSSLQISIQRSSYLEQQVQRWQHLNQMVTALDSCRTLNDAAQQFRHYMPKVFPGFSGSVLLLEKPNQDTPYAFSFWGDMFEGDSPLVRRHPLSMGRQTLGYLSFQCQPTGQVDWQAVSLSDSFFSKAFELITHSLHNLITFKLTNSFENNIDPLTGLWNRSYILSALEQLIRKTPKNQALGVILLDLDYLQKINEQFGIAAGDSVMQNFSALLKNNASPGDVVARYGGKEFIVVVPNTSAQKVLKRAERIRKSLEYILMKYDRMEMGRVTVSAGVALYPYDGSTVADILDVAERLRHQAQRTGRNRVIYFGQCDRPSPGLP